MAENTTDLAPLQCGSRISPIWSWIGPWVPWWGSFLAVHLLRWSKVDGELVLLMATRNPVNSPAEGTVVEIPLFTGVYESQVVKDFFHRVYEYFMNPRWWRISSINSMNQYEIPTEWSPFALTFDFGSEKKHHHKKVKEQNCQVHLSMLYILFDPFVLYIQYIYIYICVCFTSKF